MQMRPEARRQLDEAFQRRAGQWQGRVAANREHAVRVGRALGLGEPLGIYHAEITPALGARRVLRLLSPVAVFVLVAVLLMVWAPDAAVPVLGVAPFLVPPYAVLVLVLASRRGRFTRWLYGYTGGLVELDPDGQPRPARWDDVADVVDAWNSDGAETASFEGFRLTTADGRTLTVTASYSNALDPHAPVGRLVAALTPAARFPSISDLITEQAVARVVARQAGAVRGGAVVVRGGMRVTRDGIAGPKDATVTPWAAIERVELRPGHVKVRPVRGRARTYDNYRDESGYAVLCRLLLALGAPASFVAAG